MSANYATNAVNSNVPEVKVGEVEQETLRLIGQEEVLSKQISELEMRLTPVLAQRAEMVQPGSSQPEPVRVPLAEMLHQRVYQFSRLSDSLQSIINRIEL